MVDKQFMKTMKVNISRFNHVQVPIPPGREAEARAFYGGIMGFPEIQAPEVLVKKGFFWFQLGDFELHLGPEEDFHVSKRHPAYEVKDLKNVRTYLESKGVKITDTDPLPDRDRFFVYDPFGNRMELIEMY